MKDLEQKLEEILSKLKIGQEYMPTIGHATTKIFVEGKEEARQALTKLIIEAYIRGHKHEGCEHRADKDEPDCSQTCTPSLSCVEKLETQLKEKESNE